MKGSVSEPSEHVVGFSSVERVVAAVSCHHTFIIIIHDLIMPNSDFKYYAVGVVPCKSQKKNNICYKQLLAVIKLFTMDLSFSYSWKAHMMKLHYLDQPSFNNYLF